MNGGEDCGSESESESGEEGCVKLSDGGENENVIESENESGSGSESELENDRSFVHRLHGHNFPSTLFLVSLTLSNV